MPVTFNPRLSTIFRPVSSENLQRTISRGISSIPSSIEGRLRVDETGGICSWFSQLIAKICRRFRLFHRGVTTESRLERRITQGKERLDQHFQTHFDIEVTGEHSAIIVVMKCGGQSVVSFGRSGAQRSNLDVIKTQLRELLSRGSGNEELKITTMFLKKSDFNTYNWGDVSTVVFDNGQGGDTHYQNRFGASLPSILRMLALSVTSPEDRLRIGELIRQL